MKVFSLQKTLIEVLLFTLMLFALLFTWANLAPIQSATLVQGHVRVEGFRKKVVPMEGGVVKAIYVQENDRVQKDQLLLEFNSNLQSASLTEANKQLLKVELDLLRHQALLDQLPMQPSPQLNTTYAIEHNNPIFNHVKKLFEAEHEQLLQNQGELEQQKEQIQSNINWDKVALKQLETKRSIFDEEYQRLSQLNKNQFSSAQELNALKIKISEISSESIAKNASLSKQSLALSAIQIEKSKLLSDFNTLHLKNIHELNGKKWQLQKQFNDIKHKVLLTKVLAPVAGSVINLQYHTQGEAIKRGAYLMDIVPSSAPLIIEAQLSDKDIELVQAGNLARVRLLNFNQRQLNPLAAKVTQVSADRFVNADGSGFYRLLLEVDAKELLENSHIKLQPGMPIQAHIQGRERTLLDYILGPVLAGIDNSLRE